MAESTLDMYIRPDNILVVSTEDTSDVTLQDWHDTIMKILNDPDGPVKHLYDFRKVDRITLKAVREAAKMKKHPRARFIHVAVLTRDFTTIALVKAAISVTNYGDFGFFAEEDEAITWLNEQIPKDKPQ
jgi:hypothetical protein